MRTIEKTCLGKKRFSSEKRAKNHYRHLQRCHLTAWHKVVPYKCIYCDGWHLGRHRNDKLIQKKHLTK